MCIVMIHIVISYSYSVIETDELATILLLIN